MGKALTLGQTASTIYSIAESTQENGSTATNKDMENLFGQTETITLDNGSNMNDMELAK